MTPFEKTMLEEIGCLRGELNTLLTIIIKRFEISTEELQNILDTSLKKHGHSPVDTYKKFLEAAAQNPSENH